MKQNRKESLPSQALRYRSLSLAVRHSAVLLPFDVAPLLGRLFQEGYFLPEELKQPLPLGRRLEPTGVIARKADVAILMDSDRYILAVHAKKLSDVTSTMDFLETVLEEECGFDSPGAAAYYEFLAATLIDAKRNPLDSWASLLSEVPLLRKMSSIFGVGVAPFGLKVGPERQGPNQANWFDLEIQPLVQDPTRKHLMEIVFRRADRGQVFGFVQNFEDIVDELVTLIEQG